MDWKQIVRATAPVLGTALGGPLAGAAVKALGDAVLGKPDASQDEVAEAVVQGLSPESILALKKADLDFKERMRAMDIDILKLNADVTRSYLTDTQDARRAGAGRQDIFWLGVVVLLTFAATMGAVLWGSFLILTGKLAGMDPGVAAAVFGLAGTVVGYIATNAQQVLGYFFGSSQGSADKTTALVSAVERVGSK